MDKLKFHLPDSMRSQIKPHLPELTDQGVKIEWVENPFAELSPLKELAEQAALVGCAYASISDGKVSIHSITEVWLDDCAGVGSLGWKVQNRLNWATLLICHHCGIQRDVFFNPSLTTQTDRLLFTQCWAFLA